MSAPFLHYSVKFNPRLKFIYKFFHNHLFLCHVFDSDFINYTYFTHIEPSNTEVDDVPN